MFIPRENLLFLDEWLKYHVQVGVEHFYLYDNSGSVTKICPEQTQGINRYGFDFGGLTQDLTDEEVRDALRSIIDGSGLSGKCTLIPWRPRNIWGRVVYGQSKAVKHCLQSYGAENEWLCFIDIDEFLYSPSSMNIHELLDCSRKDGVNCLVVTQKKFADRFLSLGRFVTDIYDCIDNLNTENWGPKNVVRPDCVDIGGIRNIHSFSVCKGRRRVLDQSLLRLNHYNVNPTQLRWMEKFFGRKGIEINSLDMGMERYQDYIHTRCKREADFYRIADRTSIELKMLEI